MAKVTKAQVDKDLRDKVFNDLMSYNADETEHWDYQKINDRQWGTVMMDLNGHMRYVRIGVIVAEERDDMSAEELMASEIEAYEAKQADKAEKAKKKAEKIAKDKARREAEAEAKAKEEQA